MGGLAGKSPLWTEFDGDGPELWGCAPASAKSNATLAALVRALEANSTSSRPRTESIVPLLAVVSPGSHAGRDTHLHVKLPLISKTPRSAPESHSVVHT